LHEKSIKADLINFERAGYFDSLSRAVREAPWRPNSILNNLISISRAALSFMLMAGLIISYQWILFLILLAANVPSVWLRLHYASILYDFKKEQTPAARKTAYFNWLLTGDRPSREIRLFGLGNYFIDLFRKSFSRQKDEELEIIKKRTTIQIISDLVKAVALLATIWIISSETIGKQISIGQMAMLLVAYRQGLVYIKDLFSSITGLYEDSLYIEDTFEFLGLEERLIAEEPVLIPGPLTSGIYADNLSFTYPGNNKKTINAISFGLRKGEVVAIVGPNGAGKSTLAKLLCRLYDPDEGSIYYDNQNIRHFSPDQYRRNFSVVFQDFMLYNLTAGENIRLGRLDASKPGNRIESAAASAGVDKMIETLPSGYETMIGNLFEESRELSWGEWQKLAIARALFRDAPILILDEPSSALDAETEYEIFSKFREIVRDKTSIIISHRFTNVSIADRIIVLENGSVSESGTHEQLMSTGGKYCEMFMKQSSMFSRKQL
jgi:ATP-binding cassette, subfamily B, bacterial